MYRNRPYLHSSLARSIYERLESDKEMQNFNKSTWYECQSSILQPLLMSTFLQLNCDEETQAFLDMSITKSDWLFTQIFHALASTFLTFFMEKTSINGFLGRGSMFVFSHLQFEKLLGIPSSWKSDHILDIGAGDGKVTEIMASYFHHISVTEASPVMRTILTKKGYRVVNTATWSAEDIKYDVITCLNVLDRCDRPLTLLQQMTSMLKADSGLLVIAVVIPFQPYVEFGSKGTKPLENFSIFGDTFEDQVSSFQNNVLAKTGWEVIRWTKVPYLCEGNLQRAYFWLTDVVFVLKKKVSPINLPADSGSMCSYRNSLYAKEKACLKSEVVVNIGTEVP